mmetsp:Transcript_4916/g.5711  ORF Transcript_4916/g.5711 Transcript_4916/m.5711 type:complete len:148 (-) Transcript_4916:331-774(-)
MAFSMMQTVKKTSPDENKPFFFSKAASCALLSFCGRRRKQKQIEIIVEMPELHSSSSTNRRRKDSDCELVGLQLLSEESYNNDFENDNWDELSLDGEEGECYGEEGECYSSNNNGTTILPMSLPPIQSPTSIMTRKLHPLSKDKLFV